MSRRLFAAALLGIGVSATPTLRAQSSPLPPVQAAVQAMDSIVPANRMATVTIIAESDESDPRYRGVLGRVRAREDIRAMERQNRALARQVVKYDQQIVRLESHLHHLKTVVTDSLVRETARLDSATLTIRARRLALEAKLKELEARDGVPVLAATMSSDTTSTKASREQRD